jgi:hypothetical protein
MEKIAARRIAQEQRSLTLIPRKRPSPPKTVDMKVSSSNDTSRDT